MLDQKTICSLYEYRDGSLYWKIKPCQSMAACDLAGELSKDGYRRIRYKGVNRFEHQLIWVMFYGEIPNGFVCDHIDHNPSNNRIENLRLATFAQNSYNRVKSIRNTSGYKGVSWHKKRQAWQSRICVHGWSKYLGCFATPELAHEAYKKHALVLHGDFINLA